MKSTGIVRKVDELGRVVIPMELRRTLEIGEKEPLEIYTEGEMIVLRKHVEGCSNCDNTDVVIDLGKVRLCKECASGAAAGIGA
jgi:transcriptional pleiotropic regulator of transition state genes